MNKIITLFSILFIPFILHAQYGIYPGTTTENGDCCNWGDVLQMSATVGSGGNVLFDVSKQDGTPFTLNGTMYLRLSSSGTTFNGANIDQESIIANNTNSVNLSYDFSNIPCDLISQYAIYAYYETGQDWAWVGPISIYNYGYTPCDSNHIHLWRKIYGGSDDDYVSEIRNTSGGGSIVIGNSKSNDGDVGNNNGSSDGWVLKLDIDGDIEWSNNFGSTEYESLSGVVILSNGIQVKTSSVEETSDGGFIILGYKIINSDKNCWVFKLSSNGVLEWEQLIGGSEDDYGSSIQEIPTGGFIVGGTSKSNDIFSYDFWVAKLGVNGSLEWENYYGGSDNESIYSINNTSDGGFIALGSSSSNDGDLTGNNNGGIDYWVVKLSSNGNLEWENNFGGSLDEQGYFIENTVDGGYLLIGSSLSNDGDVGGNNGQSDYWVVKLSSNGNLEWENNFGGSQGELPKLIHTSSGNYKIFGVSASNDGDVGGNNGQSDYWLIEINSMGNLLNEVNFGGCNSEGCNSIDFVTENTYILSRDVLVSHYLSGDNNYGIEYIDWSYQDDIQSLSLIDCYEQSQVTNQQSNGTAQTIWENGASPYNINLNGPVIGNYITNSTSYLFENLSIGNYTVEIIDANDCSVTCGFEITEEVILNYTILKIEDVAFQDNYEVKQGATIHRYYKLFDENNNHIENGKIKYFVYPDPLGGQSSILGESTISSDGIVDLKINLAGDDITSTFDDVFGIGNLVVQFASLEVDGVNYTNDNVSINEFDNFNITVSEFTPDNTIHILSSQLKLGASAGIGAEEKGIKVSALDLGLGGETGGAIEFTPSSLGGGLYDVTLISKDGYYGNVEVGALEVQLNPIEASFQLFDGNIDATHKRRMKLASIDMSDWQDNLYILRELISFYYEENLSKQYLVYPLLSFLDWTLDYESQISSIGKSYEVNAGYTSGADLKLNLSNLYADIPINISAGTSFEEKGGYEIGGSKEVEDIGLMNKKFIKSHSAFTFEGGSSGIGLNYNSMLNRQSNTFGTTSNLIEIDIGYRHQRAISIESSSFYTNPEIGYEGIMSFKNFVIWNEISSELLSTKEIEGEVIVTYFILDYLKSNPNNVVNGVADFIVDFDRTGLSLTTDQFLLESQELITHLQDNYQSSLWGNNGLQLKYNRNYQKTSPIDLEFDAPINIAYLDANIDFSLSLGKAQKVSYPLQEGHYSQELNEFVPIISYPNDETFVNIPEHIIDQYWNNIKSSFNNVLNDFQTYMIENVNLVSPNISSGYTFLINTVRSSNVFRLTESSNNIQTNFENFSQLEISFPNDGSVFSSTTDVEYSYYFPNGSVKGNLEPGYGNDTILFISDIFSVKAKDMNGQYLTSSNQPFSIYYTIGEDDLSYYGLPTNSIVKLYYTNETMAGWLPLDNILEGNEYNFNDLGVFALGVTLDIDNVKPEIEIGLIEIFDPLISSSVSLTDVGSGVNWGSAKVYLNNNIISSSRDFGFTNQLLVFDITTSMLEEGDNILNIRVEDNVGNFNQIFLNIYNSSTTSNENISVHNNVLKVYPNPSKGIFNVLLSTKIGEEVDFKIYDINGRLVYSATDESSYEDLYVKTIYLNNLDSGTYIIKVSSSGNIYESKIILMK